MSFIVIKRRWGIAPNNLFPVDLSHDRDVLSNRKSERVVWVGEAKTVDGGVVRQSLFLDELERAPFDGVEYLTRDG